MELRQLRYFVAVCDDGNFTRAAERLHVVQSAVSAAIKALESELRVSLFDRSSKRMDLTEAGQAFLPRARATLDAAQSAQDVVDEVRGGLRGTVRVGTMTSVVAIDVPGVIGRFHRAHPEVVLQLRATMRGSAGLATALADGTLDLAFLSAGRQLPAGLVLHPLFSCPIDLLVPADHRLAARAGVSVDDIADEDFIDFPEGFGNRQVMDRAFEAAGRNRRVVVEISDVAEAAGYVRAGLGVALVPRVVVRDLPGVAALTITGADVTWPLWLARSARRPVSAAAGALADMIVAATPGAVPVRPSITSPGRAAIS